MERIKQLVTVLAVAFGVSFLGGVFGWNFPGGFTTLVGLISMVCIVWLVVLVYKKQ